MPIEAEIISITRDLTMLRVLVSYRNLNQEVSRQIFSFPSLGLTSQVITDNIIHAGIALDSSLFSESDLQRILGTKVQITKDDPDPTLNK